MSLRSFGRNVIATAALLFVTALIAGAGLAQDVVPSPPCQAHEWAPVFFDDDTATTTSPLVLRVTITRLLAGVPFPGVVAEASIAQVIKGSVVGDRIRIDTRMTRCPIEMKIGDTGIIRGHLDTPGAVQSGGMPNVIVQLNRPPVAN
jgi:hypothetical protein